MTHQRSVEDLEFIRQVESCRFPIDQNPDMLDSGIMMTHYSAEVLFSDQARRDFVEPDLDPIPRYDADTE